jgi:hypothetical protein
MFDRLRKPACGLLILAWFLHFNRGGVWAHFTADDMMNISGYWRLGGLRILSQQVTLWHGHNRPFAGLFYLPIFHFWGLNPVPYHVVLLALLLLNLYLMYRFAQLVGASELQAGLATLIVAYHAGLSMLYYSTAFVYDVLCFTWYVVAFLFYARIRSLGRALRPVEIATMLLFYLCALNSKEMAISFPAALLAYEVFCAARGSKGLLTLPVALPILLAGMLTLVALYGKVFGKDAMLSAAGYRPVFTAHQFFTAQRTYMDEFFLSWGKFGTRGVIAVWLLLLYLAWRRPRPVLRFCFVFLLVTPLPIVFLPGRSAACLYIPLAAWAVFAAVVLTDIAGALAEFLTSEPLIGRAGRPALMTVLLIVSLFLWARENERRRQQYAIPAMADVGRLTWETIEQLRGLNPHLEPNSHSVFLNDPFEGWDMSFIAELWFRDPTMQFHLQRFTPISEAEQRKMHVFDYQNGRLVMLR